MPSNLSEQMLTLYLHVTLVMTWIINIYCHRPNPITTLFVYNYRYYI